MLQNSRLYAQKKCGERYRRAGMELEQRMRSPLNPDFNLVGSNSSGKSGFNSE